MFNFLEKRKVWLVYIPLTIYWIILIVATSLPVEKLPSIGLSDKINHFIAYFILSILLYLTFIYQRKYRILFEKASGVAIIICMFYGILDEVHQIFVPGRFAEVLDWAADSVGAILGVLIINILINKLKYQPEYN